MASPSLSNTDPTINFKNIADTCPVEKTYEGVTKQLKDLNPEMDTSVFNELTGKHAQWFLAAWAQMFGVAPPPMDTLRIFITPNGVLIIGFEEACLVGAVRIPTEIYIQLKALSTQNRAETE